MKQGISVSGEIFRSKPFYIVFYPGGGSSGGEITISDIRERDLSVKVDFITGIVQLPE